MCYPPGSRPPDLPPDLHPISGGAGGVDVVLTVHGFYGELADACADAWRRVLGFMKSGDPAARA